MESGLDDDKTFISAYPDGFYFGMSGGEPVSCLAAAVYENSFAFIGYYVVALPENRHKGLGLALWNHVFEELARKGINSMGLNAVPEQADNYAKSGFRKTYSHRRYIHTVLGNEHKEPDVLTTKYDQHSAVTQLDGEFVSEPRPNFIKAWLSNNHSHHCHIQDENGMLKAYGTVRKADNGYRLGPVYADNPEQAVTLFHGLTAELPEGEQVYLDIPDCNQHWENFVKVLNLQDSGYEFFRMYRGTPPTIRDNNVFAVSTVEVG